MVQVKSFTNHIKGVDDDVNEWIIRHEYVKIIDIKYNTCISHAGTFQESVLIIYDNEPTNKQDVTECSII